MIPVLRRDQRTKKALFSSDPVPLLFLPCLSLKAQLQSFVTPPRLFFFFFSSRFTAGPEPVWVHPSGQAAITPAVFQTLCYFLRGSNRRCAGQTRYYTSPEAPCVARHKLMLCIKKSIFLLSDLSYVTSEPVF